MKIPSACKVCGEDLSTSDMELWLKWCEKGGVDPLICMKSNPPGVMCISCTCRFIDEKAEDGNPDMQKLIRSMRANHLGIRRIK